MPSKALLALTFPFDTVGLLAVAPCVQVPGRRYADWDLDDTSRKGHAVCRGGDIPIPCLERV